MEVCTKFLSISNWTYKHKRIFWKIKISKFHRTRGHGYPKWPPFGQNFFLKIFLAKNAYEPESPLHYQLFDTNFMTTAPYLPKLWPFKDYGYPKKHQILNTHISQNMGPRAKKFGVAACLPKGYLHTKNEQNRRQKIFWWSIFTLISARMPLWYNCHLYLTKLSY